MLEDRSCMQEPVLAPKRSISIPMLVVPGICSVLQCVLNCSSLTGTGFLRELFLTGSSIYRGHIWQFFTFQFLHADFIHAVFNGIVLFFCGRVLEGVLSNKQWLCLYFGSGAIGGIFHALGSMFLPYNFPTP